MEWFEETLWPNWAQKIRVKEVLYHEKTAVQDLIVFDSWSWGRVLALDGVVQVTTADEFVYHEMMIHPAVLAHGRVEEMLIIGGGDGGCLREACRYPTIRRITEVEIDAGVIEFCRRYLPTVSAGAYDDPRVRIVIADGAAFVRNCPDRFDVIVVDSTDPRGPGEVLFTAEFYTACRGLLKPGGIVVTQCGNPAIYPDELVFTQERQRKAGFADVTYFFAPVPTYIGANMALGWASDEPAHRRVTVEELQRRGVPAGLKHYTPAIHLAAFAHPAWMIERVGY
jgi:spermidine synthase